MLQAYRLVYDSSNFGTPQLWEWQQPHIDNLYLSARTFGHRMKQRYFLNEEALYRENSRIWRTHHKPNPAHDHIASWQELLAAHRQVVAEVLEIAAETAGAGCAGIMYTNGKAPIQSVWHD